MRTPDQALAFLEQQRASGSTSWDGLCESLCRQAYGLPAHYPSANDHARAVPAAFRHGHEQPRKGDLVLYVNPKHGHVVVATGNGWECYTNDYAGRGRVSKTDARNLVSWCGASSWFVADAWWSSSNNLRTHTPEDDMPLTDDDVRRIADAVWAKAIRSLWDGKDRNAASILAQTNFYAIQAGATGTTPSTATSSAGQPTTAARILAASGGAGGASAEVIADAVADELAQRMTS